MTVLLALLGAVLLREVGDTVANAMGALRQMRFAGCHLRLHLLAKGAVIGRRSDPYGTAGRHHRDQNHCRGLAFEDGAHRRRESGTHVLCLLPSDTPITNR